ncbi:hypothetical protein ACFL34_01385 [Candidatus Sumerlaeota bacterium]
MNGLMSRTNAWLVLLVAFMMLTAPALPISSDGMWSRVGEEEKKTQARIAELEEKQQDLARQEKVLRSELAKKGVDDKERLKLEEQLVALKKKQRTLELEHTELSRQHKALLQQHKELTQGMIRIRNEEQAKRAAEAEQQRRQQADTTRVFEDVFSEYLGPPDGQKVSKEQFEARIAEIIKERKAPPSTPRPLPAGELGAIVFGEMSRVTIADEFPEIAVRLKRLVVSGDPAARAKGLELQRQLAEQAQDLRELKRSDPEAYEQAKKVQRLEVDSELLGQEYRAYSDEKVRAKLREQLQEVLEAAFDARMVMREREAQRIEQELDEIRLLLANRAGNREQIIERRRNKLLGVEDAMDW